MARRTKYRQAVVDEIVKALKAGNTRRAAAAYAGINSDTLYEWMKRYPTFSVVVEKAEADAEVRHVANVAKAAMDGTWTASAWWLERRRHQDWGKVDRVEITIRQQAERLAQELGLDPDELIAEAERIVAGAR